MRVRQVEKAGIGINIKNDIKVGGLMFTCPNSQR